jgi:hypothetical protein
MLAIGTYLELQTRTGAATGYCFQNFFRGETRNYNGKDYVFAAFGFSGSTVDIQAGNVSASMVFDANELDLVVFTQAASEYWLASIRTVWLDPEDLGETETYSEELYSITGYDSDLIRLSVRLGSPLDAISQNAPRRALNQKIVGALPSTGQISLN